MPSQSEFVESSLALSRIHYRYNFPNLSVDFSTNFCKRYIAPAPCCTPWRLGHLRLGFRAILFWGLSSLSPLFVVFASSICALLPLTPCVFLVILSTCFLSLLLVLGLSVLCMLLSLFVVIFLLLFPFLTLLSGAIPPSFFSLALDLRPCR